MISDFGNFSSGAIPQASSALDPLEDQLCRVCEEKAAGFHFGAFTCEGCKSFFGRFCNNQTTIPDCKNGYRCVVDKRNRTACKACRLRKCLSVGMSKSGCRYGRRSNWFKIHCLMQKNAGKNAAANNNNNAGSILPMPLAPPSQRKSSAAPPPTRDLTPSAQPAFQLPHLANFAAPASNPGFVMPSFPSGFHPASLATATTTPTGFYSRSPSPLNTSSSSGSDEISELAHKDLFVAAGRDVASNAHPSGSLSPLSIGSSASTSSYPASLPATSPLASSTPEPASTKASVPAFPVDSSSMAILASQQLTSSLMLLDQLALYRLSPLLALTAAAAASMTSNTASSNGLAANTTSANTLAASTASSDFHQQLRLLAERRAMYEAASAQMSALKEASEAKVKVEDEDYTSAHQPMDLSVK